MSDYNESMEPECNLKEEDQIGGEDSAFEQLLGDQLCRLCANNITEVVYIFGDTEHGEGLAMMINKCLPVTVRRTDPLPKQLCQDCLDKLYMCHAFAESCILAEEKLQALLEKKYFRAWSPSNESLPVKLEDVNSTVSADVGEGNYDDSYCCPLCCEGNMVIQDEEQYAETVLLDKLDIADIVSRCKQEMSTGNDWWDAIAVVDCQEMKSELDDSCEEEQPEEINTNGLMRECKLMFSCMLCEHVFPTMAECLEHSPFHAEPDMFPCSLCRMFFPDRRQFDVHIEEHLAEKQIEGSLYVCSQCDCELLSEAEFKSHSCFSKPVQIFKCTECSKSFRGKERLTFHQQFHQGVQPLYCQPCAKLFPDEKRLYCHWKFVHNREKPFCCKDCGKTFVKKSLLEAHLRLHTGERPFECSICNKRFHDRPSLRSHTVSHSNTKSFQCDHCGKCFVKRTALKKHLLVHKPSCAPETICKCTICQEVFINTDLAMEHCKIHFTSLVHPEQPAQSYEQVLTSKLFTCEFCEKCFFSPSSLTTHREQHMGNIPYQCKTCGVAFESYRQLSSHRAGHRLKNPDNDDDFRIAKMYLCNYCPKAFVTFPAMALHRHRLHTHGKPFECIYCGEKFDTYSKISEHRKLHYPPKEKEKNNVEKPRPFQCEYCQKCFPVESVLIKHVRMHTGEKPYLCNICGKGFSQSSGLNTHKRVHSDERPFVCHLCGRGFKIKGDRDSHVRKHAGSRPYKCDFCEKRFMTQHVYAQHRKIHTGERPFKCDICNMAFRRSHVLTEHKRIHTGEKPHACDMCEKRYRQKGDLLKHKKTQHGLIKYR